MRSPVIEGAELNRRRDARATVRKIPERTDAMVGTRTQKKRRLREGPAFVFRF